MKKLLFIILFNISLFAATLSSEYDVRFDLLGKLGNAHTMLTKSNDNYSIRVEVKTTGIAKVLSNNRQELYESRGKIKNDILIPIEYKKTKINNRYKKIKKYIFDHKYKKVMLQKEETYKKDNATNTSIEEYSFYAKNDILTLYFNILKLIEKESRDKLSFNAIGGKNENGRIDIIKLRGEELKKAKKLLRRNSDNETIIKVIINQKIFSSKNGEMIMSINKDNVCTRAVLKDVILFGDITGIKN